MIAMLMLSGELGGKQPTETYAEYLRRILDFCTEHPQDRPEHFPPKDKKDAWPAEGGPRHGRTIVASIDIATMMFPGALPNGDAAVYKRVKQSDGTFIWEFDTIDAQSVCKSIQAWS